MDEIRDIVVGLFRFLIQNLSLMTQKAYNFNVCRLAGIEEDEDLVTVCVSDIRLSFVVIL